jgi:thiamine biosynthesis lipoprotein
MSTRWLRRARPLLGTLVEVGVPEGCGDAIERAFGVIEKVQQLMSVHDAKSDVSRLHDAPADAEVLIHPWTGEVLALAAQLGMQTGGLFDVARGSGQWSYRGTNGQACAVRHAPSCRLDLGGIAKGWAVDKAIDAVLASGVSAVWINAGGDLRCQGVTVPVVLRDELAGGTRPWLQLSDGAVATSWFAPGGRVSLHGRQGASHVSVAAPLCAVADALTKVVAQVGHDDDELIAPLLTAHGAQMWIHGQTRPFAGHQ